MTDRAISETLETSLRKSEQMLFRLQAAVLAMRAQVDQGRRLIDESRRAIEAAGAIPPPNRREP